MTRQPKAKSSSDRLRPAQPVEPIDSVRGWAVAAHPCLLDQLERLIIAAEREADRAARQEGDRGPGPNQKLLAHLLALMFDDIPGDPGSSRYQMGNTLGRGKGHWRRAKTGGGRYRLFFRFHEGAKTIVYAWVNDENSLRTYGSRTDAYAVFASMLAAGHPPDDWDALVTAVNKTETRKRSAELAKKVRTGRTRKGY